MTNALVNFGNFFNSIVLPPPPFSAQEKMSSENAVRGEWAIPVCLGDNDKTLGRVLLGGMSKNEQVQIFDSRMYLQ